MADGIESFDEKRNLARVTDGLRTGGPFNNTPILHPQMTFVNGWPSESVAKVSPTYEANGGTPFDPWVYKRPNSTM